MIEPYYQHDGITIYHGDCRDILPHLPKVDLVLADPPWGIGWNCDYSRFRKNGVVQSVKKEPIKNDDVEFEPSFLLDFKQVILWGANHYAKYLPIGSWLIWDKRNKDGTAILSHGEIGWINQGEGVYIFSHSGAKHRGTECGLHPTQKPTALMRWCIGKAGDPQLILDPFMGSGTTLVAAKQLRRKAIGIEIEKKYCDIAIERLAQEMLPL